MTTAKEVLALIITGDGRGALSELDKVGNAAERELGRSQSTLDQMGSRLTTWGAAAAGTGALAAVGLYGAAQAAGNLDANVARIEGNFGAASDGALKFVQDANAVGLADQQAAQYVANIGELAVGLGIGTQAAAGMTVETVRLVSQLALLKGQSPADALDAVSAGLIGEYDSLQRLVPSISAAAIQERALADTRKQSADDLTMAEKATATFAIITESASQTLARSGDVTETNAYRNAQLAASFGDMKTQLGEGALPVLEKTVGVLTGAADVFSDADDASNGLVSTLATYATVGAIAGGGLAFVVGQGIKARDTVSDLSSKLRTADGDLTGTGRAATGLGITLAGLAAIQIGDEIRASLANEAGRLETARKELEVALGSGNNDDILRAFSERAGAQPDNFFSEIPQVFGKNLKILPGMASETIEDIEAAFESLSIDDQGAVIAALKEYGSSLRSGSQEAKDNAGLVDNLSARYDLNRAAAGRAAAANRENADSSTDVGAEAATAAGSLDMMAYAYDRTSGAGTKATSGAREYVGALKSAFDPVLALLDANQRLADAEERMAEAANTSSRDVVQANRSLADARRRVEDATRSLSDAQAELNDVLNDDPMFGLRSVSPEEELADARQRLAQANQMLAQNPGNAVALTMRDEAIIDLEAASKRQQDEKRNAERRADDVARAQRAVQDAERNLGDAKVGLSDAQAELVEIQSKHGISSDEYRRAAQEVIEANLGVQAADADLAQWMRDNGISAVGELNGKLDEWIARGGPVGEAAAVMKSSLDPLVAQALTWAGALQGVNGQLDALSKNQGVYAFQLLFHPELGGAGGSTGPSVWDTTLGALGAGRRGPTSANPGQPTKVDQFGIPLYGRAAGGEIPGTGTGTSDDVLVAASAGEFMLKKTTVTALGPANVARLNQTGRWPELPSQRTAPVSNVTREGDLVIEKVLVQLQAIDDQLAGAAVVRSLRNVARRSGRGLRADRKLV